jgi:ATP-dependent Clp protease adaptor protein ClpS
MSDADLEDAVRTDSAEEFKHPDEYMVILLNDDYTTMEFVVMVLMNVFHRSFVDSTRIMLDVHKRGKGVVGSYPYDIAVTKVTRVHALAKEAGYPLRCAIEKI